ncbi:MAG: hypothetical protein JW994_05635 [Candidatus Omnitrophica bacterium]|nr:hypothetical protein [Candidatus Omnitrophota bacterium]
MEKTRPKHAILRYTICDIPFTMRISGFSEREIAKAEGIYGKFGIKRRGASGPAYNLKVVNIPHYKCKTETFFMRCVIRKIVQLQIKHNFLLIHAAGIYYKKRGLIFPAPSSGGKSTISRLSKHKAKIISEDSVIIKKSGPVYLIYGLPLTKPIFKSVSYFKKAVRLSKIYFPVKSGFVTTESLSKTKALMMSLREALHLIPHGFPWRQRYALQKYAFRFLDKLLDRINFAELHFAKNRKFLKKI